MHIKFYIDGNLVYTFVPKNLMRYIFRSENKSIF